MKVLSKHRKKILCWFAIAALALFALFLTGPIRWLGSPTIAIFSTPTRVETFKLNGLNPQPLGAPNTIGGYPIVARGQTITGNDAIRIGHSLLSPADYISGSFDLAACRISPGVGFRFWKGEQSVDVAVCFLCGHILVVTHDARGKIIHQYLAPFPVQKLTSCVRKAFPHDPQMEGALSEYEMRQAQ